MLENAIEKLKNKNKTTCCKLHKQPLQQHWLSHKSTDITQISFVVAVECVQTTFMVDLTKSFYVYVTQTETYWKEKPTKPNTILTVSLTVSVSHLKNIKKYVTIFFKINFKSFNI